MYNRSNFEAKDALCGNNGSCLAGISFHNYRAMKSGCGDFSRFLHQ